jgi:hypothetical protein
VLKFSASIASKFHEKLKERKKTPLKVFQCMDQIFLKRHGMRDQSIPSILI